MNFSLEDAKKIHFVGVGGSGTYPMVQILHQKGYIITGSDNNPGDIIDKELAMGLKITIGHSADNIDEDVDIVMYSAAIPSGNPELMTARDRGITLIPRAEALGYITSQYDNCICVSGTHGKTSTTAMLTQILFGAGLDPTAVIGGSLPAIKGYGRAGESDIMTCEACEYQDTFLHLFPDIGIILNVDEDHMEYFKTMDNVRKSFNKFAKLCSKVVIVNGDDSNTLQSVENIETPIITFGLGSHNQYRGVNIQRVSPTKTTFDLLHNEEKLTSLTINVPGEHHIYNAIAACVAALYVGATPENLTDNLPDFMGAGRRFEMLGTVDGVHIADDYAHHPKEISATLNVAKTMGFNDVWAVFQPFTYSRTKLLLDDFADALKIADHVVMSEIMGGREVDLHNIYTKDLAEKIPDSLWFPEFPEIAEYVMTHAKPGDLVITLGCGDVYKCARMMLNFKKKE